MRNLSQIFLAAALGLLFNGALAETTSSSGKSGTQSSSGISDKYPGFFEANLGLVKKTYESNCVDRTTEVACMVRSSKECVALMDTAFDTCWPTLKPKAPRIAGPEALKFYSQIEACVIPKFKQLVAESDARIENYKVPCP